MRENEESDFNCSKTIVCEGCAETTKGIVTPDELLFCELIVFVKSFCYLADMPNASGESEAAVTAGTKIRWIIFRDSG